MADPVGNALTTTNIALTGAGIAAQSASTGGLFGMLGGIGGLVSQVPPLLANVFGVSQVGAASAQVAAQEGAISNQQGIVQNLLHIFNKFKILSIVMLVIIIINCLFQFFFFLLEIFMWIGYFAKWLFYELPIWLAKVLKCAVEGLINLPQCFLWYLLDFIAWVIYLPFRFVFWVLDYILGTGGAIVGFEHNVWCFLGQLDSYIHDPSPAGLGTGIHIIHYSDSTIKTCYSCITGPCPPFPVFDTAKASAFIDCVTNPYQGLISGQFGGY